MVVIAVVIAVMVVIMIMVVPVLLIVPAMMVFVPPFVILVPATLARFAQFVTRMVGLRAVRSVVLDRFVQPMIGV